MKPKLLFVYDHPKPEQLEGDGLWSALKILEKYYEIEKWNLVNNLPHFLPNPDFVLGWGAFGSKVDKFINEIDSSNKKGLCLAAQFPVNETAKNYDVIFYETYKVKEWLVSEGLTKLKHAFGINTEIYKVTENMPKVWDNISVGSFSKWHRQDRLYDLSGQNLAVGEIQQDNLQESFNYVANLLLKRWSVSNWVNHETLAKFYNMSRKFVATAEFGQERAVLEARACGIEVEVPDDNSKLRELLETPIYSHVDYARQLKKGIEDVIGA